MSEAREGLHSAWTRWITRFEDLVLTLLLGAMVILSGLQILLRNGFDSGLPWIDPLLRVLVLWLGLVGAIVAARRNKHIRIDLVNRYLGGIGARVAEVAVDVFTAAVCALVAWHGARMVLLEKEFAASGVLDIPMWVLQLVIPVAFSLVALIYLGAGLARLLPGRKASN